MTEDRHCVRCGNRIPEGSEYCPSCGAGLDGSAYETRAETVYMENRRGYGRRPDTLGVTPTLILVYGILAAVFGIMLLVAPSFVDWGSLADESGLYMGMTESEYSSSSLVMGAVFLISGVCALIASILSKRRERFLLSWVSCLLASLVPLAMALVDSASVVLGIILCVIGLLMTYRIYSNRDSFSS